MKKLYIALSVLLPSLLLSQINKPSDLTFENITTNSVVLKWQDKSDGETGYKIYRDGNLLFVAGKNVTSFKDTNLVSNHTYKYEIKTTDDAPFWTAINSTKDTISTDDSTLEFDLFNLEGGDEDWVGIFNIGDELNRGNLLGWGWTDAKKNGKFIINTIYPNDGHLSAGDYQAVLFYNNSYIAENRTYFDVKETIYGQSGNHPVKMYDNDNYSVYHSEDVENAPVVVFLSGWRQKASDYVALMKFIASQGYYVIGLNDSFYSIENVLNLLADAKNDQNYADTNKINVMGHSLGGSYVFNTIKVIKENGYALKRDSVMELDGWFAMYMNADDMKNIDTTSLIIQYGGIGSQEYVGDDIGNFQDPKVNLAVYYMLQENEKALRVIDANTHGYQYGGLDDYETLLQKQDLLKPLHAFLEYTLKDDLNAKDISLRDDYKGVEDYVNAHPDLHYDNGCVYYKEDVNNYCDLEHILSNGVWWDR